MTAIQVGDHAPDFAASTPGGQSVSLAEYRGKQAVVLFFYPKDGSPLCTREACSFRDSYEKFRDAGAEVIGVSSDSRDAHREFAQRHQLPFPLVSDADGSLRSAFGVPKAMGLLPGRTTYVIDKQGIVRLVFTAQLATDEHVDRALEALQTDPAQRNSATHSDPDTQSP